jgi:hypothetical protein
MSDDALYMIIRSRDLLQMIDKNEQNGLYLEICNKIETYINKYCNHDFIDDMIDIDPDKSISIRYCKNCSYTLPKT